VRDRSYGYVPVVGLAPQEGVPHATAHGISGLAVGGEEGEQRGEVRRYRDHGEAPFVEVRSKNKK
jgi:hypothetical protein